MPSISDQRTQSTTRTRRTEGCAIGDTTSPPQPNVDMAVAFSKAPKGSSIVPQWGGDVGTRGRDPLYIQLSNVEVGTTFELVNLSKKPNATFKRDAIELAPTGRDIDNRTAAIYLPEAKMKKLGIEPGDVIALRAKDAAGNVSPESRVQIDPQGWASQLVQPPTGAAVRGTTLTLLDGEAKQKQVMALAVPDSRPPVVDVGALKISRSGELSLTGAVEPFAQVRVINQRTGYEDAVAVAQDGTATVQLSDAKAGDILTLKATDASGIEGKTVHLTVAPKCKDGIARGTNAIGARLPGVIP